MFFKHQLVILKEKVGKMLETKKYIKFEEE